MRNEYKIVEGINGGYFIQVKVITTKGMLWWKKSNEEWLDIDTYGNPYYYYQNGYPFGGFIDLEDAKVTISYFKNKTLKSGYCGD
jgi:hypothetical protein